MAARVRAKAERRKLLCRKKEKDGDIAFLYKLYREGAELVIEITIKGKSLKSHIKSLLPFETEKAAKEFFDMCVKYRVTPLNLCEVCEDYVSQPSEAASFFGVPTVFIA